MLSQLKFNLLCAVFLVLINQPMLAFLHAKGGENYLIFTLIYVLLVFSVVNLLCFFRFLSKLLAYLLLSVAIICSYFSYKFGVFIEANMLVNALATDARELSDLFSPPLLAVVIFAVFLLAFLIFKIKLSPSSIKARALVCVLFLAAFFALAFINSRALVPFLRANDSLRYLNIPFYQFYAASKLLRAKLLPAPLPADIALDAQRAGFVPTHDFAVDFSALEKSEQAQAVPGSDGRLFVLVVGETARAANYSIAGYSRNQTNAYTTALPLVFLRDFSSCGTATATSLPCMFSPNARDKFTRNEPYKGALNVLKRFAKVLWLDNNSGGCKGVCDEVENRQQSKEFDSWLIDDLALALDNLAPFLAAGGDALIVLHIQGSHGPSYYKRYPAEFERFKPVCKSAELASCSEEELFNTYDNSILFTDYLNSKAFELAKLAPAKHLAFLYLSDHGESLGEGGLYLHGMPYALSPREQRHIPAQIYASGCDFSNLANLPLSQDNLFHSLLGFFGIFTQTYDEKLDLFALCATPKSQVENAAQKAQNNAKSDF